MTCKIWLAHNQIGESIFEISLMFYIVILFVSAMENRTTTRYSQVLQTEPLKTTLFRQEPSGITYRIPALIYIQDGQTFLAFAEKRCTSRDSDAKLLVMRRGTHQNGFVQVMLVNKLILPGLFKETEQKSW